MRTILICALAALLTFRYTSSIYSFKIEGWNHESIDFNDFRGKKILVVNIATGSARVSQVAALQQLQDLYRDSLVVIGFPSNSFGNETMAEEQLRHYYAIEFGAEFRMAAKNSVNGSDIQPIYFWLTRKSENGGADSEVNSDFQKYLIDVDGTLIGLFSGELSPLDAHIVNAIK
jgi:glutathione peroxidase